jgi:hypothetical protein
MLFDCFKMHSICGLFSGIVSYPSFSDQIVELERERNEIVVADFRFPPLAQLSRFYLKTETESSLRNVVFCNINRMMFLDKDSTMDNV